MKMISENYLKKEHKITLYLGIFSAVLVLLLLMNTSPNGTGPSTITNSKLGNLLPNLSVAMNYVNSTGNIWNFNNGTGGITTINSTCINMTLPVGIAATWAGTPSCPYINRTFLNNTIYRAIIPLSPINPSVLKTQFGMMVYVNTTAVYYYLIDLYDGTLNGELYINTGSVRTLSNEIPLSSSASQICLQLEYFNSTSQLDLAYSYDMVNFPHFPILFQFL